MSKFRCRLWLLLGGLVSCSNTGRDAPPADSPLARGHGERMECREAWKKTEVSLLASESQQRQFLSSALHQGAAVAAHYDVEYGEDGCRVRLEILPNCHTEGWYQFHASPVSDYHVVNDEHEAFAKLTLWSPEVGAKFKQNRAFRADFMYVGVASLPMDLRYDFYDFSGDGCERATHVIGRVYVGGMAWAFGDSKHLEASASLFKVALGAASSSEIGRVHTEGSVAACEQAQQAGKPDHACDMPLHIGLIPIKNAAGVACSDLQSCRDRCDAGYPQSCFELGEKLEKADDIEGAVELYDAACSGGVDGACYYLASMHLNNQVAHPNPRMAMILAEGACEHGHGPACELMAETWEDGKGGQVDLSKALFYYEQACRLGTDQACPAQARLARQACDNGSLPGCTMRAAMHDQGVGGQINPEQAAKLYDYACRKGYAPSCVGLGVLHMNGRGVERDPRRSAQLYDKACTHDDAEGCLLLGELFENGTGVSPDVPYAVTLYDRACARGHLVGCTYLGHMYRDGKGVEASFQRAAELFEPACRAMYAPACMDMGELLSRSPPDAERAEEFFEMACEGGIRDGCRRSAAR